MAAQEIVLLAAGVLAGIYIIVSLVRAVRKQSGVTRGQALLIVLAMLGAFAAAGLDSLAHPTSSVLPVLPLAVAGLLLIGGLVVAVLERLRRSTSASHSAGLVGLGAGVLLAAFLFARPVIFGQLLAPVLSRQSAPLIVRSASDVELVSAPAKQRMFSNVVIATPVPYLTSVPMTPTPTPTPYVYHDPLATEEATAAVTAEAPVEAAACSAVVTLNLNLRAEASKDAALLATIPFNSVIPVEGLNADGTWLKTRYQDKSGWVSVAYVALDDDCMAN